MTWRHAVPTLCQRPTADGRRIGAQHVTLILGLLIPVAIVGGLGAFITFLVRGATEAMTLRNILRTYLRVAFIVSLGIGLVGASMTLTAAFASAFGRAFSYVSYDAYYSCAAFADKCAGVPQPPPDTRQQDDLILGLTLLVAGIVIGAGHKVTQRVLETPAERHHSALARIEALIGTGVLGVAAIIAVPIAIASVIRHLVVADQSSLSSPSGAPGGSLATAIVLVPVWLAYLVTTLRRVLGGPGRNGGPPPVNSGAAAPASG